MRKFRDVEELKEDLRAHVDIVRFIGRYIELRQRGNRWLGFCPFHEDVNNPGFAVSPDTEYTPSGSKGVWACWTCDKRGDVFKFAELMHDASFFEAIVIIAEIVEFDLTPYYREMTEEEKLREQRYAAAEQVADLFTEQLLNTPKKLKFFTDRGIEAEILAELKVGWCPSMNFFNANVSREVRQFLEPNISNRARLFGDRFVYAQFTPQGRVWGWYARQPDNRPENTPKYVGISEESPLFDGKDRVYGLFQARKIMRRSKLPVSIVEGFHDTIAIQQAGFPAVGACGTNLSAKQIETLQGNAIRKAVMAFDPDEGGERGMIKAARTAHQINGIQLQFATMALEPEEFIAQNGPDAYAACIQNAVGPIDYIISRYEDSNLTTATKKRDFLDHIGPYLMPYPRRSLDRALGVQAVSRVTGLSEDTVSDFLDTKADSPLSNLTGEMILLAELANNPASWLTLGSVMVEDFSLRRYAQTFALMQDLREKEAEVSVELLLTHAINEHASQEVIETISKLAVLPRKTPELFAQDVRDKAIRRRAEEFASVMQRQVRDLKSPVNETLATLIEDVTLSISTTDRRSTYSSVEAVTLMVQEMERRAEGTTGIAGLNMGPDWEWYTMSINGHRPGRVNGIFAASGVGKSNVGCNWIHKLSIADQEESYKDYTGNPAIWTPGESAGLIVTMEMTKEELIEVLTAIDSGVPHSFVSHARFEAQEQIDAVYASAERIQSKRLTWMEGQRTIKDIAMTARMLQARGELDYIWIDYVQLLDLSCYPDRWSVVERYGQASQDVKNLAENLRVPIIEIGQLNRSAMAEDTPTGEQMGSAYKIYQDAHSAFMLAPRDIGLQGSLDKNRGGGKGQVKLSFDTNPQTSTIRIRETSVNKGR